VGRVAARGVGQQREASGGEQRHHRALSAIAQVDAAKRDRDHFRPGSFDGSLGFCGVLVLAGSYEKAGLEGVPADRERVLGHVLLLVVAWHEVQRVDAKLLGYPRSAAM